MVANARPPSALGSPSAHATLTVRVLAFPCPRLQFIYLSKKIAIPNGVRLKSLSWNGVNGWIVCGGENGLLKVLKLDSSRAVDKKGAGGPSNLSMNQTLEGHNGSVVCVCWNENYRKLTTSDQYGLIIVWMLHKGMWFEEMINNRNKSTVRGMSWTADGQRICIIYEDGAVIVGSVDGNRLWGKELKLQLSHVEWSPDGLNILFGTLQCEVYIYDANGNYLSQLPLYCLDDSAAATSIIGIDWYDGAEGVQDATQPTLAIGVENGRLQLMRHEHDDAPVLIDTGLTATNLKWATNGSVLALAGSYGGGGGQGREVAMVQFYSPYGQHLRTLKVPGGGIQALSWEGGSLRVALAVDTFIYFANIRPDYRWGFFGDTLVAAYAQPERTDSTVLFWNTKTDERTTKYYSRLLNVKAASENCVLAMQTDSAPSAPPQYMLLLCNAIGSPLDSKHVDIEPTYLNVTPYHVVTASHSFVYVWQYRTLMSKLTSVQTGTSSLGRSQGRERCFHIDDPPASQTADAMTDVAGREPSADPIIAIGASQHCMLVARESGTLLRYSLPHIALEHTYTLRCRPQTIAINCDSTRAAIIDTNGILSLFDLGSPSSDNYGSGEIEAPPTAEGEAGGRFERKDVWDVRWAEDNPLLFALMEKTRMYIFNGLAPEEPVLSSAYICSFSDLEIRAVMLDQLLREPEQPTQEYMVSFEVQALREARELLETTSPTALSDAQTYIEGSPHPRLWRLLAESALQKLDFVTADKAFVQCSDYMGIQFVKRCKLLDDEKKQQAEVAVHFGKFDEAEKIYKEMDRKDLALQLRINLGDWFKVVTLLQQGGGDDEMLATAWNHIGDYYMERQMLSKAVQHYAQAKNLERLVECYALLEDYPALEKLIAQLPDRSPLLPEVGKRFMAVGMSAEAVGAFLKGGDVHAAIESCVAQHQWEAALTLAEGQNYPDLPKVLAQYASQLLAAGKHLHAVELYRKANQYTDAAKLLSKLGEEEGHSRIQPLRAKKLFVMAALEVERMRKKMLNNATAPDTTRTAAQTLESLMTQDNATGGDKWLDSSWKGAEAYHFLLLCERQLYAGYPLESMRTALRLREYENVLPPAEVYALIALTAFYSKYYGQCSKAFIRLQGMNLKELPAHKKEAIDKLALSIFTRHQPQDPTTRRLSCPQCNAHVKDFDARCGSCGTAFPPCVFTGKSILDTSEAAGCKTCKRRYLKAEARNKSNCGLCHTPLPGFERMQPHIG